MGGDFDEGVLKRLVQVGIVTDIKGTTARVKFPDTGLTSDFLHVLQRKDEIVAVTVQAAGTHSHSISVSEGSASCGDAGSHTHVASGKVVSWMPKVNESVLVVFLPIFNSDGFILGGI